MISISKSYAAGLSTDLETKHFLASQTLQDWQYIWELFYQDAWFRKKLNRSARYAVRQSGLGRHCIDDVQQEALVEFAKSLQRDPSLGFDPSRGDFRAFLVTIVHRCCQKGLRQFRMQYSLSIEDESLHPCYEDHSQIEEVMDLRQLARQIPEPYRGTVRQICNGLSIDEIARKRNRSKRTIYRWIDKSIVLLQTKYFGSTDRE